MKQTQQKKETHRYIKSIMETWQVDVTANHLFLKRRKGSSEKKSKHIFILERCPVVRKPFESTTKNNGDVELKATNQSTNK